MPNLCFNEVSIRGTKEAVEAVAAAVKGAEHDFDSTLIEPEGSSDEILYDEGVELDYGSGHGSEEEIVYKFVTAWDGPHSLLESLSSQHPEVTIVLDERGDEGGGVAAWRAGKLEWGGGWDYFSPEGYLECCKYRELAGFDPEPIEASGFAIRRALEDGQAKPFDIDSWGIALTFDAESVRPGVLLITREQAEALVQGESVKIACSETDWPESVTVKRG